MASPLSFHNAGIIVIPAGSSESSNFTTLGISPPQPNEEVVLTPEGQNVQVYLNYNATTPGNSTLRCSTTVSADLKIHFRIAR